MIERIWVAPTAYALSIRICIPRIGAPRYAGGVFLEVVQAVPIGIILKRVCSEPSLIHRNPVIRVGKTIAIAIGCFERAIPRRLQACIMAKQTQSPSLPIVTGAEVDP